MTAPRAAFLAKHAARITRDPVYGCWLFADPKRKDGGLDRDGYGTIWTADGPRRAHLVAYRELVGPVPAGLVLDHLCRRRACCRPEHLEPIKGAENDLRRSWRVRCRRATCPNGREPRAGPLRRVSCTRYTVTVPAEITGRRLATQEPEADRC